LVGKDGSLARIGLDLAYLFQQKRIHEQRHAGTAFVAITDVPTQISGSRVTVEFVLQGDPVLAQAQLASLGMLHVAVAGNLYAGELSIEALDEFAGLPSLSFARPSYKPITAVGIVDSQGDPALRADVARSIYGLDGSGTTVGILSDSFDAFRLFTGIDTVAQDIASGDLPADTTILQDARFGGTDEGRGMAQLVHDVAPGAAIQFATADGGEANFANNIRRLADAGSSVIVDDIIYLAEPFFQDGVVAQAVDDVVERGIPYFSAAGNNGDESYQAAFGNSGQFGGLFNSPLHDFDPGPGVSTQQQITVPVGGSATFVLQWDQPFASLGGFGSTSDIDISLWGANGTTLLAGSAFGNVGSDPLEIFGFFNSGSFNFDGVAGADTTFILRIELFSGAAPGLLKYVIFGDAAITSFDTNSGTMYGHANAAGAESVAASVFLATPAFGVDPPQVNDFSSSGGTPILFDAGGNRLASQVVRQGPDVTGVDGANTTFFGQDISQDADAFPNFFGTSAAAPHVAAVAALLQQSAGGPDSLAPSDIYDALESTAIDITSRLRVFTTQTTIAIPNGVGLDAYSGHGLVDAVAAIQFLRGAISVNDVARLEGNSGLTNFVFTLNLIGEVEFPVVITYATVNGSATAPGDYIAGNGAVTFLPGGATTRQVTIQVVGDEIIEPNETFFLDLDSNSARLLRSAATGTILNDDVDLSINDISIVEGNFGTSNAVFTLSSLGTINETITVNYATTNGTAVGGLDYVPQVGQATLDPTRSTTTIVVPIINDTFNEATEAFFLNLSQAINGRIVKSVGTATIIDNDPLPAFYVNDAFITTDFAGLVGAVFTVALDNKSGRTVTVQYRTVEDTATAGEDYTAQSGTLTFLAGTSSVLVTVPIATSGLYTGDERFFLEVSNPTNSVIADARGEGIVIFGDPPPAEYVVDDGDAAFATNTNGGWINLTNLISYQFDYTYHTAGAGNNWVSWTFTDLPDATYQVFTRWSHFSNRATNAPYTVFDGAAALGTVSVNQQVAPAGDQVGDIVWQKLGNFTVDSGTLRVRLTDAANGFVTADAVRLVAGTSVAQAPEINVAGFEHSISDGDATPTFVDATEFGAVGALTNSLTHAFSIRNTGNAPLQLGGNPPVQISGLHAGDFTVLSQPAATIAPGAVTTFQVMFHPSAVGLRQATISIASNDANESTYDFAVQGTGGTPGGAQVALAQVAPNPSSPLDVNADSLVSPLDVLIVFNALIKANASAAGAAAPLAAEPTATPSAALVEQKQHFIDVNGDGIVSPIDALLVINHLLAQSAVTPSAAPTDDELVAPLASVAMPSSTSPELAAVAVDLAIHSAPVADESDSAGSNVAAPLAADLALADGDNVDTLLFDADGTDDDEDWSEDGDEFVIADELLAAIAG
ncbi:MAG: Calx-beta domain-containing protein, partial [Pirellulales bacterium]